MPSWPARTSRLSCFGPAHCSLLWTNLGHWQVTIRTRSTGRDWTGGTRLDICYLWSVRTPGGCERQLSFIRLSELLSSGRRVPFPQRASTVSDENRQQRLEVMAQNELTLRRTYCLYLGVEVRPGRFEEDPHKWHLGFTFTYFVRHAGNTFRSLVL